MSKSEQILQKLINDFYEKIIKEIKFINFSNENEIKEKLPGTFLFGFISGIIFAYSGLMAITTGFFIGIIITLYYNKFAILIVDKTSTLFYKFYSNINVKNE